MSVEVEEDLLRAGEIPSGASVLHVIAKRLGRLLDSNQTKQLSRVAGLSIPEWRVLSASLELSVQFLRGELFPQTWLRQFNS